MVEFGLVGHFMHEVDERVPAQQVRDLQNVYLRVLQEYFA